MRVSPPRALQPSFESVVGLYHFPYGFVRRLGRLDFDVARLEGAVLSAAERSRLLEALIRPLGLLSLAAVANGARQVECTINGLGERAGNCSLEEVVMAVRTRRDYFGLDVGVDASQIVPASRMVSQTTGFVVQPNKAVVGANAFAHESGIHQDGMLKNAQTYEIMTPESVGVSKTSLVMGKHSGRHAFKQKLESLAGDVFQLAVSKFAKQLQAVDHVGNMTAHNHSPDDEARILRALAAKRLSARRP